MNKLAKVITDTLSAAAEEVLVNSACILLWGEADVPECLVMNEEE